MCRYFARLCWNTNGWVRPSGVAGNQERNTFAAANGFGYEEWLFSRHFLFDGWHYGQITGVGAHYAALEGRQLDLRLYTLGLGRPRPRYFVGQMKFRVLTQEEAGTAYQHFTANGMIAQMIADVAAIGHNAPFIATLAGPTRLPRHVFNIRYRREHVDRYSPPQPVPPDSPVRHYDRYILYRAPEGD